MLRLYQQQPEEEEQQEPVDVALQKNMELSVNPMDQPPPEGYKIIQPPEPGEGERTKAEARSKVPWKLWDAPTLPAKRSDGSYTPGVMQIIRPRLKITVTKKMSRPRVPKNDLAGGEIRGLHRLITDEKVLRRKAPLRSRKKVGTMMIDVSGSMSIRQEDLDRVMDSAPQVTIAVYSSNLVDNDATRRAGLEEYCLGHLAIVAHRGKRCAEDEMRPFRGGGNVVDEEALRWLTRQPGPRVWICDGSVTGCHDESSQLARQVCQTLQKRGRIVRYFGIDEYFNNEPGGPIYG